jgi:hypothetical protein
LKERKKMKVKLDRSYHGRIPSKGHESQKHQLTNDKAIECKCDIVLLQGKCPESAEQQNRSSIPHSAEETRATATAMVPSRKILAGRSRKYSTPI